MLSQTAPKKKKIVKKKPKPVKTKYVYVPVMTDAMKDCLRKVNTETSMHAMVVVRTRTRSK